MDAVKLHKTLSLDQFIDHCFNMQAECMELLLRKNHDYSGGEDDEIDPLANFRKCEEFGVPSTQGIMVRLSDKFSRLETFFKVGRMQVADETVADTLLDIINYTMILDAILSEQGLYALDDSEPAPPGETIH